MKGYGKGAVVENRVTNNQKMFRKTGVYGVCTYRGYPIVRVHYVQILLVSLDRRSKSEQKIPKNFCLNA